MSLHHSDLDKTKKFLLLVALFYANLAFCCTTIIDESRPWEGIVMKKASQICTTIDDFQHYIDSLPQPNGVETNFGVSDANGDAAYFEVLKRLIINQ